MEEVRRLRLEKGWNQTELAYHAKLAPSVISLLETGKREPNASTLRKLAGALGVTIPDLFREGGSSKGAAPPPSNGERGGKETADALASLLEDQVGWGQEVTDELKASTGEFPLGYVGAFIEKSWNLRRLHDGQLPEVREAPHVRAARERLEEVESQMSPLTGQWFGPGKLGPEGWKTRERFGHARSGTQPHREADDGADTANEADAS
jgi:transcriptional regulator with XRE-family HTH domain